MSDDNGSSNQTGNLNASTQADLEVDVSEEKVLILGPVGSGKRTTIKTLSDSFTKSRRCNLDNETITIDHGMLRLEDSKSLSFLATDGQDHSKSFWDYLKNQLVGILLLIDNRRKDPLHDLENFLEKLITDERKQLLIGKIVIGITHVDVSRTPALCDFHECIGRLGLFSEQAPPMFSVDARKHQHMSMLLQTLLYSQDPYMSLPSLEDNSH